MPEFICCGPNNACINAEHIVSMEWAIKHDLVDHIATSIKDWLIGPNYDKVFKEWVVRVTTLDGSVGYISAPYTAWFENFIGPMPEKPKE